jgi:YfiH family protein
MSLHSDWIVPDWEAPPRVRAFATTRAGGVSEGDYGRLNLGIASGDDPARVARNREVLRESLPGDPPWLRQVHGIDVADLDRPYEGQRTADAAVTSTPGRVAGVLTADCMPLLLADRGGTRVAVAHAGWRGMAAGVIERTVAAFGGDPSRLLAWMGPTIGPDAFEVGAEVRDAFVAADPAAATAFVPPGKPGKYMADLYALARQRLERAGVRAVAGGGFCTFHEPDRFFSYRRVAKSGRMGTFIWIEP